MTMEDDGAAIPVPDEQLPEDEQLGQPDAPDQAKVPGDELPAEQEE